ncbi:MAG TPA: dethiobiotin synthase [Polyangiaceae bacterium]|jgi:dethiobiotin synthetase
MTGRLVVVTGTGTEIGKTHLAEAVLLALGAAGVQAVGLKPVESGVTGEGRSDAARLEAASTFHVKPFGIALRAPISPHRAARLEGVTLPLDDLAAAIHAATARADLVLVELPGGLFTPLADRTLNADFALRLRPDHVLLVAPDRLGVLHDVLAATRAAAAASLPLRGIALVTPERPDPSTGTNAADLGDYTPVPVLATVPRGAPSALAAHPSIALIVAALRR